MKALDLKTFSNSELVIMLSIAKRYKWRKLTTSIFSEINRRRVGAAAQ